MSPILYKVLARVWLRSSGAQDRRHVNCLRRDPSVSIRRVLTAAVVVILLGTIGYTGWQVFQLQRDLRQAEASADALRVAVDTRDAGARDAALLDLQQSAGAAESRTDGWWWSALTVVPLVGDDARGLRAVSSALSSVADDALPGAVASVDDLDTLIADGRIDLEVLASLDEPVGRAATVIAAAADEVNEVDSDGFFGALKVRYRDLADQLDDAATGLRSADTALDVLPAMVGAEGPRTYLLLFQNNAEIRATGGMPGSWALVRVDDGQIDLGLQGTAGDFPRAAEPVIPLTPEEIDIYGAEYGVFFQNPGVAPDFPRAADLWRAHWDTAYPGTDLDGVIALDPVALSYLLRGTGPVEVAGRTVTSDNAVDELLSRPYLELEPTAQDEFFAEATKAIFEAVTGELASPLDFAEGFSQAARERRFLVASFDDEVSADLSGTRVAGEWVGDDGATPHFDIGLNDAGASKMSYYLRYAAELSSTSCDGGQQQFFGQLKLRQTIAPDDAAGLPESVTGALNVGVEPGEQAVFVRLYGPAGGSIEDVMIDGRTTQLASEVRIDDRQVITLLIELSTVAEVLVTWTAESGEGQTEPLEFDMTPGVATGDNRQTIASSC
jgi:hypothetical protein